MENLEVRPSLSQEFTNLTVYGECKSEKGFCMRESRTYDRLTVNTTNLPQKSTV